MLAIFGVDRSIANTLLLRVSMALCNFGTIFFIGLFLTPELQGYYYTFNSLVGLQVFVELGFNFAVVQIVSHEMAKLRWNDSGVVVGNEHAKRRMQSLVRYIACWFSAACPLVVVILLPAGFYFFGRNAPNGHAVETGWAWTVLVAGTAFALLVNIALAVLEGCNKVADVALVRIAQNIAASTAVCCSLAGHCGLYSLAIGSATSGIVGACALLRSYRHFYSDIWSFKSTAAGMNVWKEVWPFQWRIAVSWASGYLVFQLFNPLLFATHGPVAAGRMGMTLQITGGLTSIASVWMTTKAPVFGRLIALGQSKQLNAMFKAALTQSTAVLLGLSALSITGLLLITEYYPNYALRLLPIVYFSLLCLIAVANHLNACEASYLRAYKEEPFMIVSLMNALVITSLAFLLIKPFGFLGAILAYGTGAIVINLGVGSIIFFSKFSIPSIDHPILDDPA